MDAARFIFLDETGLNTKMTRLYGRAPRGERLVGAVPHGHWRTTTFIAGLRQSGVIAPMLLDGPMTGAAFRAYIEQALAPALQPGDIVVMDNLAAHKIAGVSEAIAAVGGCILYLPPYSPDLNPIEQFFAKLKAQPPHVPKRPCGPPQVSSSTWSHPANAATISPILDMIPPNSEML